MCEPDSTLAFLSIEEPIIADPLTFFNAFDQIYNIEYRINITD